VNNLREPAPILAQRLTEILGQHLGKAVYGSKGCPQVMRNGIGEGLQRLIGRREFLGAFLFALMKFSVLARNL